MVECHSGFPHSYICMQNSVSLCVLSGTASFLCQSHSLALQVYEGEGLTWARKVGLVLPWCVGCRVTASEVERMV